MISAELSLTRFLRIGYHRANAVDATLLLNDPDMTRFRASYFEMFPVWRHGDWIKSTSVAAALSMAVLIQPSTGKAFVWA